MCCCALLHAGRAQAQAQAQARPHSLRHTTELPVSPHSARRSFQRAGRALEEASRHHDREARCHRAPRIWLAACHLLFLLLLLLLLMEDVCWRC